MVLSEIIFFGVSPNNDFRSKSIDSIFFSLSKTLNFLSLVTFPTIYIGVLSLLAIFSTIL